jgi:ComF family protein
MIAYQAAERLVDGFVDLLFPPQCVWCHVPSSIGERLCDACRQRFVSNYYRCQKCAAPLPRVLPNADCIRCRAGKWRFDRVYALAPYRGDMRRAVIMMKRRRFEPLRRALADLLGEKLLAEFNSCAEAIKANALPGNDVDEHATEAGSQLPVLVPVPYHWSHSFSTAADTAELLAYGISQRTSWPVVRSAIGRVRKTAKQGVLTWAERKVNVRQAFAMKAPQLIEKRHVLLVDDVMTSGATTAELSRLLLKAGAMRVSVVVAARASGVRESPACQ